MALKPWWQKRHVHIWEEFHRKVLPKGHEIIFLDGNKDNFDIENLKCVPVTYKDKKKQVGGKTYTYVKFLEDGDFALKRKEINVWESFHKKKMPERHEIVFLDGDRENFSIENLECVPKKYKERPTKLYNDANSILKNREVDAWKQFYGEDLPEDRSILFADGNRNNLSIENLVSVPKNTKKLKDKLEYIQIVNKLFINTTKPYKI